MKINQKGFSAVEIIIAVVVVAALGFAGYTVLHHSNNKTPQAAPPTTASEVSYAAGPYVFDIPSTLKIRDEQAPGGKTATDPAWTKHVTFYVPATSADDIDRDNFSFIERDATQTYDQMLSDLQAQLDEKTGYITKVSDFEANGLKAIRYSVSYEGTGDTVVFVVNGKEYRFDTVSLDTSIMDKVVTTFRAK
jgi:prepilin-type N-terminal cleavage/methylation domain-containing protein